jgi:hypothetical protein
MKLTIEIPDDFLRSALCGQAAPSAQPQQRRSWVIRDPAVRCLLWNNGFSCLPDSGCWCETNCPIAFNGTYTLRDGSILESQGTELVVRGRGPVPCWAMASQ